MGKLTYEKLKNTNGIDLESEVKRQLMTLFNPEFEGEDYSASYSFLPDAYYDANARDWVEEQCEAVRGGMIPQDTEDSPLCQYIESLQEDEKAVLDTAKALISVSDEGEEEKKSAQKVIDAADKLEDVAKETETLLSSLYTMDKIINFIPAKEDAKNWDKALADFDVVDQLSKDLDEYNALTDYRHLGEPAMQALLGYVRYAEKAKNNLSLMADNIEIPNLLQETRDFEEKHPDIARAQKDGRAIDKWDHYYSKQIADAQNELSDTIQDLEAQRTKFHKCSTNPECAECIDKAKTHYFRARLGETECQREALLPKDEKERNALKAHAEKYSSILRNSEYSKIIDDLASVPNALKIAEDEETLENRIHGIEDDLKKIRSYENGANYDTNEAIPFEGTIDQSTSINEVKLDIELKFLQTVLPEGDFKEINVAVKDAKEYHELNKAKLESSQEIQTTLFEKQQAVVEKLYSMMQTVPELKGKKPNDLIALERMLVEEAVSDDMKDANLSGVPEADYLGIENLYAAMLDVQEANAELKDPRVAQLVNKNSELAKIKQEYKDYLQKRYPYMLDSEIKGKVESLTRDAGNMIEMMGTTAEEFKKKSSIEEKNIRTAISCSQFKGFDNDGIDYANFKKDTVFNDQTPKYLLKRNAEYDVSQLLKEMKNNKDSLGEIYNRLYEREELPEALKEQFDRENNYNDDDSISNDEKRYTEKQRKIIEQVKADCKPIIVNNRTNEQVAKDKEFIRKYRDMDFPSNPEDDKRFTDFKDSAAALYNLGEKNNWGGWKLLGNSNQFENMQTALKNLHDAKTLTKKDLDKALDAAKKYKEAKKESPHWGSSMRKFRLEMADRTIQLAERALATYEAANRISKLKQYAAILDNATSDALGEIKAKNKELVEKIHTVYDNCTMDCQAYDKREAEKLQKKLREQNKQPVEKKLNAVIRRIEEPNLGEIVPH